MKRPLISEPLKKCRSLLDMILEYKRKPILTDSDKLTLFLAEEVYNGSFTARLYELLYYFDEVGKWND